MVIQSKYSYQVLSFLGGIKFDHISREFGILRIKGKRCSLVEVFDCSLQRKLAQRRKLNVLFATYGFIRFLIFFIYCVKKEVSFHEKNKNMNFKPCTSQAKGRLTYREGNCYRRKES